MAKTKSSPPVSARFSRFSGIDTRYTHSGEPSTADLVNFRILPDGSLQKREGFAKRFDLPDTCRATWSGKHLGRERTYLLCGNTVCTIIPESQALISLGTISTEEGDAGFFYHRDSLYLSDNVQIYRIEHAPPVPITPYIPLIGRDWTTKLVGETYERRSHATRQVRISYVIEEPFIPFLRTNGRVESVDSVWVNGTLLAKDAYYIDDLMDSIVVSELQDGDRVMILFTYAEEVAGSNPKNFATCTRAENLGGIHNTRLLLWKGERSHQLFLSDTVTDEMLTELHTWVPEATPLYFPDYGEILLGDGRYPITGLCRHYDRLLVFTSRSTYMSENDITESQIPEFTEINPYFGCASPDGITHCDNDPITVGEHAILRWNEATDERDERNARDISTPVSSLLSNQFFPSAIVYEYPQRHELWFHARGINDVVWIYNTECDAWYRFTGIQADQFLTVNGSVAFCRGNALYTMDEYLFSDWPYDFEEKAICATMKSGVLEYGTDQKKHACGLSVRADGGPLTLTLSPDVGPPITAVFPKEPNEHRLKSKRIASGRFAHATLTLTANDPEGRPTVHSISSLVR